jgi:hypothetical protein
VDNRGCSVDAIVELLGISGGSGYAGEHSGDTELA